VIENTYNRLLFLGQYYFVRLASLLRLGLKDQLGFIKGKARAAWERRRRRSRALGKRCR
jgi:hypothetical protein